MDEETIEKEDLIFHFKDNDYKLLVSESDCKSIKLSMENLKTGEFEQITIDGLKGKTPAQVVVKDDKDLIKSLLDAKIFDYCNSIFAQINVSELYKYDQKGVKAFVKKYARKIIYRKDKENSEEEIKHNIRKDSREILNCKEVRKELRDEFDFLYSVLDKDKIKDSYAVFGDKEGEYLIIIQPYRKGLNSQLEIVPEYAFSNVEGLFHSLNGNCQIIQIAGNKYTHEWIMEEAQGMYPDFEYKDGVQKYLRYCVNKKIDKEDFIKRFPDIAKMLKKERMKSKERSR